MDFLPALVEVTDYDLDEIARLLSVAEPPLAGPDFTVASLKVIARAWMDDMHEYCNISNALSSLDPAQIQFCRATREFRRDRPWLRDNYGPKDRFDYIHPIDGRTVFTSLRHGPDGEQVFSVAHLEGKSTEELEPLSLPVPGIEGKNWRLVLRTPSIGDEYVGGPIVLKDSMALVYVRYS
jgi:hypothetical protein